MMLFSLRMFLTSAQTLFTSASGKFHSVQFRASHCCTPMLNRSHAAARLSCMAANTSRSRNATLASSRHNDTLDRRGGT